jgi:D-alanyl-D-alanine carboxypeptidase (penicillin-binding protein 5/6)
MLDYAFSQYTTKPLYKKGDVITKIDVNKGSEDQVTAVTSEPISVLLKKGNAAKDVKTEVKMNEKLNAPIQKGDKIGMLTIKKDNKVVSSSPLLAKEDIDAASWWKIFKRTFSIFSQTS